MTSERRWRLSLALIGVAFGMALPGGAGCHDQCPDWEAVDAEGIYQLDVNAEETDWMTGSGHLEVTQTAFLFSYATMDGSLWEVEYVRTVPIVD